MHLKLFLAAAALVRGLNVAVYHVDYILLKSLDIFARIGSLCVRCRTNNPSHVLLT